MLEKSLLDWIKSQLSIHSYTLKDDIKLTHVRPWSQVATIPTTQGTLYCKMTLPDLQFEVRLTDTLCRWGMPVPKVIAIEAKEGWLLMQDSGLPLRQLLQADGDIGRWHTAVTQYAQMQITLIPHSDALLATGLFDRRLTLLPTLYDKLLQDTGAMMIGQEDGLTAVQYVQLQQLSPHFATLCQQLAAFHIPQTLHHDDFHDANIFVQDDTITFADWGEACYTHPFFSMIIVLRIAEYILKLEGNDPALAGLRDTYLAQWQDFGTATELMAAFEIAHMVGMVNRALTWHTFLGMMSDAERAEEADAVPGWLQEFLEEIG